MCKNWITYGNCRYGKKCQFAHGEDYASGASYPPEMARELYLQQITAGSKTKVDSKKFKTEMCKNWIEAGTCRYGNKCQFSHGEQELVVKNDQPDQKYKTKHCESFSDTRFCPYGNRCLFRHEDRTFTEIHKYHYVSKLVCATENTYLSPNERSCSG